jgi:hypothetical protein
MIAVSMLASLLHECVDATNDSASDDSGHVKFHRLTSALDRACEVVETNSAKDSDSNEAKRDTTLQNVVTGILCSVTRANVHSAFKAKRR